MSNDQQPPGVAADGADRFFCRNTERPKRKAKVLKKELEQAGFTLGLTKCHGLVARMYGYRDWDEFCRAGRGADASPDDENVDEDVFTGRFWFQVQKLMEIGVSQAVAEDIIDRVRPTSTTYKTTPAEETYESNFPDSDSHHKL
jgi:hypothetical protein